MRSVEQHQSVVAELIRRPEPVAVDLADALGLALAEDVHAAIALPGFDNSGMDGYAVRASEVAGASKSGPVTLPVAEDIPAGRVDVPPLQPGTVHRIMTGAPVPSGADAVIQVEATDGGTSVVTIFEGNSAGAHIRLAGEDVRPGELVLTAGAHLGAPQLGLLAALGTTTVRVIPPLRVLVLSTGSELVEPGRPLQPGQIYESNGVMLTAAVNAAGAHAERLQFVSDDVEEFHAALQERLDGIDLVLTSGGVSAGAYEVVKDALTGQGVEFAKVAMQPGMPQGAGRFHDTALVTMPGNPVSSLVSFEVFVRPAIRAAMGLPNPHRRIVRARLEEALISPGGKRQFRRGHLVDGDRVGLVGPAGSHFLRWLAAADCLIDIGADVTALEAGTVVDVWVLD
jgi:molybdopterin molybdotransferase